MTTLSLDENSKSANNGQHETCEQDDTCRKWSEKSIGTDGIFIVRMRFDTEIWIEKKEVTSRSVHEIGLIVDGQIEFRQK